MKSPCDMACDVEMMDDGYECEKCGDMKHAHPRFTHPAYDSTRCALNLPHIYGGYSGTTCSRCGKARQAIEDAKMRIAAGLHLERKGRGEATERVTRPATAAQSPDCPSASSSRRAVTRAGP